MLQQQAGYERTMKNFSRTPLAHCELTHAPSLKLNKLSAPEEELNELNWLDGHKEGFKRGVERTECRVLGIPCKDTYQLSRPQTGAGFKYSALPSGARYSL